VKIITSAGDKRWLVEIDTDELAKLRGFSSLYAPGYDQQIQVGAIFNVGKIFEEATAALDTHKNAVESAKRLRASADKFLSFFNQVEKK
jgi:hypothetical protein